MRHFRHWIYHFLIFQLTCAIAFSRLPFTTNLFSSGHNFKYLLLGKENWAWKKNKKIQKKKNTKGLFKNFIQSQLTITKTLFIIYATKQKSTLGNFWAKLEGHWRPCIEVWSSSPAKPPMKFELLIFWFEMMCLNSLSHAPSK